MRLRRIGNLARGVGEVVGGVLRYPSVWMGLYGGGLMVLSQTEAVKNISSDELAGYAGIALGILGLVGVAVELRRESGS